MQESEKEDVEYVKHPLLENGVVERRMYQMKLAGAALEHPSLVVLPTGTGKTTVALLVTAARLENQGGKSLFLAPTKPLVEQHAAYYREALSLPNEKIKVFTGDVRPDERKELWGDAEVVIATPQVVENDVMGGGITLENVTHLTFDECHRATGDYSYNYIAERYWRDAKNPLVTGMTASPGSDKGEILEVCDNLGIENVEIITEEDSDLSKYTHDIELDWRTVEVPDDVVEIRNLLNDVLKDRLERLQRLDVLKDASMDIPMDTLLKARRNIQGLIDDGDSRGYSAMSVHAEVMKLRHAVERLERNGVDSFLDYLEKLENEARSKGASKAVKRLLGEPGLKQARRVAREYEGTHPKMDVLRSEVIDELSGGDSRVIVFTEYRDNASTIVEFLDQHDGIDPVRFVGQSSKEGDSGLTQNQQNEILDAFREGRYNVLVATSVAEEGLDVPEVDLVLFYEPVPSEIRAIQRRGRTGRRRAGRVVVLMAEDTRDEAYFWSSRRKEDKMKEEIRELKKVEKEVNEELEPDQKSLGEFSPEIEPSISIIVDQRETKSSVVRSLDRREDVGLELETLEVADYILSDRVAIERKSADDFVDTITGGRSLFEQAGDLKSNYSRPIYLVEGRLEDLYSKGVHPNAVRGALASLSVDFGVSVLFTSGEDESAEILYTVAKREQEDEDREVRVHGEKSSATLMEQQEYVVSSIADVGPVTARKLLEEFGSVESVMTASKEELKEAEGVGEKTAERIREVVGTGYGDE